MQPSLTRLISEIKAAKIFRRNKKNIEIKILAALLYFFGLSLRRTSQFLSLFKEISHESVRIYYHMKMVISLKRKKGRLIAIDETKNWKQIFVWSAIDVAMECFGFRRKKRLSYVFFEGDAYCENKPEIVVEVSGTRNRLGLSYEHETFGRCC